MKNTNAASSVSQKQNWEQKNGERNRDNKVVNEQEQQEITNNDEDKDKQYDKQNKDRSWQGGKEEEIGPDRPDEQTDDSDETEKKIPKMSM